MNDATDDDERELRNICHSAKKFVLRYVFLVSNFNCILGSVQRPR
jgi:hypothetical protein